VRLRIRRGFVVASTARTRSGLVTRVHWRQRITARDAKQGFQAAGDNAVARDDDFSIAAARRCESAPNSCTRGERRQRALVAADAGERERLRVEERRERDRDAGQPKSDSRTR
jgi:hypothetical protein